MTKVTSDIYPIGRFITFEGGDGSGKTTQIQKLREYLDEHHIPVLCTHEPGGTDLSNRLRHILLECSDPIDPYTELLLFTAARRNHVERIIKPALQKGIWVLCDRFYHSTVAYQGAGHGVPYRLISYLHENFLDNILPDLTFLLDIPFEIARARIKTRTQKNYYDNLDSEMYHKIQNGFYDAVQHKIGEIVIINATNSVDQVAENIQQQLQSRYPFLG